MKINHVKVGIILSYILMFLNAVYGFIITPVLIKYVGTTDYGVYKTISSLTASVLILDLGLGDATIRYISNYITNNEKDKIPNFLAMVSIISSALSIAVGGVCFCISFFIRPLYGTTFTSEQLELAYKVFIICSINVAIHIVANVFNGVIAGLNKFAVCHTISIAKILIRVALGMAIVIVTGNILLFICVDLVVAILVIVLEYLIIRFRYNIRIRLHKWDKVLFSELIKFSLLLFVCSIANQICDNLDNIIIGAMCGPDYVAVYSVGIVIFVMFGNISCAVSGVMLPTITKIIHEENHKEQLTNLLIKVGRIQFMLLSACIVGFAILGKDFISAWLGEGFDDVYIITLILIIPSIFEYCINTALSILKAKNLLSFRTFALVSACLLNLIVTIILVKYWSYIGAAIGTSVTYLICSLILMNIYYYKKLKLPMLKIYYKIIKRIWICLLIAGGFLFIYSLFFNGSIYTLIGGIAIFCIIYALCLLLFGLTEDEKIRIPIIGKLFAKKGD